ncbi:MAG: aldehyde dehydrogenase family protein, partial [Proteobacteria bacterium]|nr:aldehyde dehydrogenase family protein [Pseudomonadota bacterium]
MDVSSQLTALGITLRDGELVARSPIDGSITARLATSDAAATTAAIERAHAAFTIWRSVPAPRRGELVRLFGDELRAHKDALAALVTIEA